MKKIVQVIWYIIYRFFSEKYPSRAASLAYSSLLSLVPLMLLSFTVFSWVPYFQGVGHSLQNFILHNFTAASADRISEHLAMFLNQLSRLKATNLISLALVCVLMIYNMVRAFNDVWHVKLRHHFALSFLVYLLILLLTPLLFGILLIVISYIASLPVIAYLKNTSFISRPLPIILPYLAAFFTFTFFNWILPSCRVRLKHAALAGAVTAVFFELAKHLFGLYLKLVPTYKIIYGALATIPLFLIWLYLSWTIILMGALFCHFLATGLPEPNKTYN